MRKQLVVLLLCLTLTSVFDHALAEVSAQGFLDEHNRLRALHDCPNLELDDTLSKGCDEYAKTLAAKNELVHAEGPFGENLCSKTGSALECVQLWYDEIKDYDYVKAEFSLAAGHFTQLVWKASKKLGVGWALTADNKQTYVVARYTPPGNTAGEFKENVPEPKNKKKRKGNGTNLRPTYKYVLLSVIFVMGNL
ncbi:CG31482 [Drosophila busckii]|uniref:CG31482 n=1 Tax=Drosophila busckii TaxID=30019 RepID=A0A0M4F3G5_DROBS|nr:Golgi-associated plant pathogenesis-related protein 1 isoform X2 [Drosophila busckii]ALC45770.1 CG31482 [Drosophila busckii]